MNQSDYLAGCPGQLVPIELTEHLNGPLQPPVRTPTVAFFPDPLPPESNGNRFLLSTLSVIRTRSWHWEK